MEQEEQKNEENNDGDNGDNDDEDGDNGDNDDEDGDDGDFKKRFSVYNNVCEALRRGKICLTTQQCQRTSSLWTLGSYSFSNLHHLHRD